MVAVLAFGSLAPSAGGVTHVAANLGESAVGRPEVRVADPAVLIGADGATRVVQANRSLPEAPFLRIVAALAALGIVAYSLRGRWRSRAVERLRPALSGRGVISLRGPPRVAF